MRLSRISSEKNQATIAVILIGLLVTAAMLVAYISRPTLLTSLDLKIYDQLLPLRATPSASPFPVIIDLDEKAVAEYGQWPWPRYLVADLVDALTEYGVAAIGLDIIFAEADRTSPERIRETLQRDKGLNFKYSGVPPGFNDYDMILAEALARTPAVLGAYATFKEEIMDTPPPPPSAGVAEREKPGSVHPEWKDFLLKAKGTVLPLPILREHAPIGFISAGWESDGIVREIPLVMRIGENIYPSLSLRVLMQGSGLRNLTLEIGPYGAEAVRLGKGDAYSTIPISPEGMLRIPFIGPSRTYPYYSAADVLARRVPAGALEGKAAFIGTSLTALMDIRATPYDQFYPGVEIHAAAVDVMLTGNSLGFPYWTPTAQAGIILFAGLLSTLCFGFARPRIYLPVALLLTAALVLSTRHLFAQGIFLSPLYGIMTVAFLATLLLIVRFWQEEQQKRKLRNIFSRYVSSEVVNRVTRPAGDLMAGEERELSIMFTDIRGFTTLSEKLTPQEVVTLLNRYFEPMTALVRTNSGTLDKFIGDALMAYWNAPLDVPDHPVKAVKTALAMREALIEVNKQLETDLNLTINIGIGVHTGKAFVGNMGTRDFINYTLIGDSVNLASRLEGLCPQYGVGIVVSGDVRDACGDAFAWQQLDTIQVKGKTQPVTIYHPMRPEEAETRQDELTAWETAREKYVAKDFAEASAMLASLRDTYPESKLYALFADRAKPKPP